jgi:hypothetical protein
MKPIDRAAPQPGPPATIQCRLMTRLSGAPIADLEDLARINLPHITNQDRPSSGVKRLVGSGQSFFLPDRMAIDLSDDRIRVLEQKRYLLGEQHYRTPGKSARPDGRTSRR